MTAYDELELDTLGDRKTALFLIMSDTDASFNFLISMIYSQLFNLLCEKADDVYGGRYSRSWGRRRTIKMRWKKLLTPIGRTKCCCIRT
mgnify:CR=1 FL=1